MSVQLYRTMHEAGHFPGHSTKKSSEIIKALIARHEAKTILDFGSGKGMQYDELKLHEDWGVERPTLYDPAVPGIHTMPNALRPFDGVIACDVLEHLEGDDLRHAIFSATIRARKFVFFSVSCRPAKKTLPDGRNCHLTVEPPDWWRATIDAHRFPSPTAGVPEIVTEFEL
tara:strand:+ start:136 stop:648 length:513 start_codon:yes stop_codon:yes gene_type:complete